MWQKTNTQNEHKRTHEAYSKYIYTDLFVFGNNSECHKLHRGASSDHTLANSPRISRAECARNAVCDDHSNRM